MCGIIGYLTKENNEQEIIIENLKKLEYRGYDSCGICLLKNKNFYIQKSLGEICNLQKQLIKTNSHCGIAHTRWATHGKVNLNNTHPHTSQNKNWCVVHNGIIANMLEQSDKKSVLEKIQEVILKLKGSFALCILKKDEQDTIYLARQNSPLFVAENKQSKMASSDPICFAEKYTNYYTVPQKSIVKITQDKISFFDFSLKEIIVKNKKINIEKNNTKLNKYKYFAEKEICEIPFVLQNITDIYNNLNYFKKINKKMLNNINSIYLIGCGSAYHACVMGTKYINRFCNIPANAYIASEFRYSKQIINKKTLCIFVSQSGETADTLLCQRLCKNKGAKTIALTNITYSSLAKNCNIALPLCAGPEIAVVSTKAYNAMIYILFLLALYISNTKLKLPNWNKIKLFKNTEKINEIIKLILNHKKIFFIGKDEDYVTSLEASLKLKEITYINCTSLPSGELKHGTISLIDKSSLVFVIATKKRLLAKNLASASEIKSRGGKVVLVTNLTIPKSQTKDIDYIYTFAKCPEYLSSIISIIPFQLIAYKTCVCLGYSPDKPRNLAKSVTVE